MTAISKTLKTALGVLLLTIGLIALFDYFTNGYDAQNEDLLKFSPEFQSLHNGVIQSYLEIVVIPIIK